ncbi:putative bifunctional diguanylate cyclase/phosphodiesterase [Roseibium hamelinense]|nr:EAL domain-containing protein [Roseibium hamelinense]
MNLFTRLRTKLTFFYSALFALIMMTVAGGVYSMISTNAIGSARAQLEATSAAFQRLETLQIEQLRENVQISSRDFGFRSAISLGPSEPETIRSALANLRLRMNADVAYVIFPDGTSISDTLSAALPASMIDTLSDGNEHEGGVVLGQSAYRAVLSPVFAPNLVGWILVGNRLDDSQMQALVTLSSIPIQAELLLLEGGRQIPVARSTPSAPEPRSAASAPEGQLLQQTLRLPGLAGDEMELELSFPRELALQPMWSLLRVLAVIGALGLALLSIAAWLLARSITSPLARLEQATRDVEDGTYQAVELSSSDEIGRLANSFNLMTEAIEERTHTITHQALHDRETGLPNRAFFEERLTGLPPSDVVVSVVGIDRFQPIRDAIGYAQTAELIKAIGARLGLLETVVPPADLSGGLLAVAFQAPSDEDAENWLAHLLDVLEQPVDIAGQKIDVMARAGFVRNSVTEANGPTVVEKAAIALDQARGAFAKTGLFDAKSYGDPVANLSLMGDMLTGFENGDIFLAYQPKLNLQTQKIESVEALLRWRHPQRGMIRPDIFVTMAENTGHIRALTEWVAQRAVADQRTLADSGLPLRFSINVSGRQLGDGSLIELLDTLEVSSPDQLCFEITETAVMGDPDNAVSDMRAICEHGFSISIDDYGSGLSSLAYLKMIPAQELKIDRSLLLGLAPQSREAFMLRSTVELGHGLGMKVVAEGVEDVETLEILRDVGCDLAQGYFICRPVPLADLTDWLKQERPAFLPEARLSA